MDDDHCYYACVLFKKNTQYIYLDGSPEVWMKDQKYNIQLTENKNVW